MDRHVEERLGHVTEEQGSEDDEGNDPASVWRS